MAVVGIHFEFGFVIGTPQTKGDEPRVQQTRVVRVFDVFQHQLPVAGDALAVVTQQGEFSAIEQAVKVMQDGGAHEVLQGLHIVVKRCKHHTATGGHLQRGQAVVFGFEVGRHAAIDLAALAHAAPKGHALQLALQVVAPLVVGADQLFAIAVALAHELHAAVGTNVFKHLHLALGIAHHDDRTLAHRGAFEVAHLGHLDLQAHIRPMLLVKKSLHLQLVQGGLGVGGKGNAAGVAHFPIQGMGLFIGVHGAGVFKKTISSLKPTPIWACGAKNHPWAGE